MGNSLYAASHNITTGYAADSSTYDLAVIGAGGAGMCLLLQLLTRPYFNDKRILVIEPRRKQSNDRTWCFWTLPEEAVHHALVSLADHHWSSFELANGRLIESGYQYHHLRSSALYKKVHALVKQHTCTDWIQDRVVAVQEHNSHVAIQTDTRHFTASLVFDSRFQAEQLAVLNRPDTVWQSFIGWRIQLEVAMEAPNSVRLMNFDVPQNGETQFMYCLPFENQQALVEITRFGKNCITEEEAADLLPEWIHRRLGAFTILEHERGKIPMTQGLNQDTPSSSRLIPIGTAAGAVKSTTGYAIKTMHDHACRIAESLEQEQTVPAIRRKPRFEFYDSLLLQILKDRPDRGKNIFDQLFHRNALHRIFCFLDEKTTIRQEIPLLFSLPVMDFLQAWYRKAAQRSSLSGRSRRVELIVLLLLLATVGLFQMNYLSAEGMTWFMLLGLIFPGIPHGAMDHCLNEKGPLTGSALIYFIGKYLFVMSLVVGLWLWNASVGVALFILYSAWHFGETDLREWGIFNRAGALLFGLSLLSIILFSHPAELSQLLYLLKADGFAQFVQPYHTVLERAAWIGFLLPLFRMNVAHYRSFGLLALILLLGKLLPLVPAFLWYFIAWHSVLGWMHLKELSGSANRQLILQATPFTLGAFSLFGVLWLLFPSMSSDPSQILPYIFIFIAALSAPHILLMHFHYRSSRVGEG
jgi:lycopene beta-cyclase